MRPASCWPPIRFLVQSEIGESLAPNPKSLSVAIREGKRTFEEAGGPDAYFGAPAEATAHMGDVLYGELSDIFAQAARDALT